jgi:hypothetical protein
MPISQLPKLHLKSGTLFSFLFSLFSFLFSLFSFPYSLLTIPRSSPSPIWLLPDSPSAQTMDRDP